jgi:cell shape-determining protein MreC
MKFFKNVFFTVFLGTFIIVGLASMGQMQGMPLSVQISQITNDTLMYLQQLIRPVLDFFR